MPASTEGTDGGITSTWPYSHQVSQSRRLHLYATALGAQTPEYYHKTRVCNKSHFRKQLLEMPGTSSEMTLDLKPMEYLIQLL